MLDGWVARRHTNAYIAAAARDAYDNCSGAYGKRPLTFCCQFTALQLLRVRRTYEDRLETQELHHLAELERLQRELYQRCRCESNTTQTQWEDAPAAFAFTAQQPSGRTGAAPLPLAGEGAELQEELSAVLAHVMTAGAFRAALLRLQLEDQQRLLVAQAGTLRAGPSSRDVERLRQLAKDTAAECDRCGIGCFLVRQTNAALVAFTSRFLSPRSLRSS
jgi:hypothetical protein